MVGKLLIIDDNTEFVISLYKYIQTEITDIETIGIASNGKEALKYMENIKPNIIILDLQMPILNGVELLKKLKNKEIKIILISGEIDLMKEIFIQDVYTNIEKIYIKPFNFCNLKEDFNRLSQENSSLNEKKLIQNINNELDKFNFNKSSIGYKYLIECIIEIYKNPYKLNNIEKNLFPCVADKLKIKNPQTIKWNLRKLIISMIRYTDTQIILKNFSHTKNPTTKMFLTRINECIHQNMNL